MPEPEIASLPEDLVLPGPHGDVAARLYRASPVAVPQAAIVWVHGAPSSLATSTCRRRTGWARSWRRRESRFVRRLPQGPRRRALPRPSDDVLAGWSWAVAHLDLLGNSLDRLHLGGASAGGNLAAGVAKRLRDGAGALPASLVLAYPVLHPELPAAEDVDLEAIREVVQGPFFSPELTRSMMLNYVGDERLFVDPYAFPSNGDVSGQPPVYLLNCEHDPLRASGQAYVQQLRQAGVVVHEETMLNSEHGVLNRPDTEDGRRAVDDIAAWLLRAGSTGC